MNFKNFVKQDNEHHENIVTFYLSKAAVKPIIEKNCKNNEMFRNHHVQLDILKKFRVNDIHAEYSTDLTVDIVGPES